jgi:hypothetical protein
VLYTQFVITGTLTALGTGRNKGHIILIWNITLKIRSQSDFEVPRAETGKSHDMENRKIVSYGKWS